jgi:hypothetical protein
VAGIPTNTKNADEILAAAQANHTAFKYIPTHDGILNNKIEVELFPGPTSCFRTPNGLNWLGAYHQKTIRYFC